jgi:hypothetical protein
MHRHLYVVLGIAALLIFLSLPACEDDDPVAPIEETPPGLRDRAITVTITPTNGLISDVFEIAVDIEGFTEDELSNVCFLWNWDGMDRC